MAPLQSAVTKTSDVTGSPLGSSSGGTNSQGTGTNTAAVTAASWAMIKEISQVTQAIGVTR